MGRKKSYKQKPNSPKREAALDADDAEDGADADPANTVIVTTAEVAETATSTAAALTGGTQAPTTTTEVPQAIAGRPEWAQVAPGRLEAAEDESFWFAFALAVMACAPPVLGAPAALMAAVLAGRILRALWSVPADVAPEDLGSARTMLFMVTVLSVVFKMSGGGGITGIIWIMLCVFFFNALRNVRMMVGVALKGGKKKKAKEVEAAK